MTNPIHTAFDLKPGYYTVKYAGHVVGELRPSDNERKLFEAFIPSYKGVGQPRPTQSVATRKWSVDKTRQALLHWINRRNISAITFHAK